MQNLLQRPAFTMVFSLITISMLIIACTKKDPREDFNTVKVETLKVDNQALGNKAEVTVIDWAEMPDFNDNLDYFIPLTVVTVQSGDTFYLLTTSTFDMTPRDRTRNYFSYNSIANKFYQSKFLNEDVENLMAYQPKTIETVLIHKEATDSLHKGYPIISGVLGHLNADGSTTITNSEKY